jgi:hypothetical protein
MVQDKYKALNFDKSSFDIESIKKLTAQLKNNRVAFSKLNNAAHKGTSITLTREPTAMKKQ